jgi:hypothetical protein
MLIDGDHDRIHAVSNVHAGVDMLVSHKDRTPPGRITNLSLHPAHDNYFAIRSILRTNAIHAIPCFQLRSVHARFFKVWPFFWWEKGGSVGDSKVTGLLSTVFEIG